MYGFFRHARVSQYWYNRCGRVFLKDTFETLFNNVMRQHRKIDRRHNEDYAGAEAQAAASCLAYTVTVH